MTSLLKRCLSLDRQERERLIEKLRESLETPDSRGKERFEELHDIATEIFGQGILTILRDYNMVLGRRFIAYQMLKEGYSKSEIGRHLTRDHATVFHMQKRIEDMLAYPEAFKREIKFWTQFQNRLKEHDTNR